MRAVQCVPGGVAVVEVDEPGGDGELVHVSAVSICASDFQYIAWGSQQIIGHEIAGVLDDGTPVAVEGMFGCGACEWCERGNYNLCSLTATAALGIAAPGGMSEFFRAPARALRPLPMGLAPEDACLVEPGSVAWHACRTGGVGPDTRVVVVGAGAIGLLAVAAAQALGAAEVAVEARHPHQREAAERFGAVQPRGLYDVVIESAGSESSLHRSFELVRPAGTVVTIGVFTPDVAWPHLTSFLKEAKTAPSLGYCADGAHGEVREFDRVAAMLVQRPEIAATLITHRFGIDEAVHAFDVARKRENGVFRVVVHP